MALQSSFKNMLICLTTICLVCSALLAGVYAVTAEPIAAAAVKKTNDAIAAVLPQFEKTIGGFVKADQEILKAILQRKLTIGLSKASFDKLIGEEATKEFTVTLAHLLDKVKGVNPIDGTFFASRKCDGCRCVVMVKKTSKNVSIDFISRQGKPFTTLDNVKEVVQCVRERLSECLRLFFLLCYKQ